MFALVVCQAASSCAADFASPILVDLFSDGIFDVSL